MNKITIYDINDFKKFSKFDVIHQMFVKCNIYLPNLQEYQINEIIFSDNYNKPLKPLPNHLEQCVF